MAILASPAKEIVNRAGRWTWRPLWLLALSCGVVTTCHSTAAGTESTFSFTVAGDIRQFAGPAPAGKSYFDGACAALQTIGPGAFLVSPGDIDPPQPIRATLDSYLGSNFLWYPLTGNHETEKPAVMTWLRSWSSAGIPHLVRRGPPGAEATTYSFDLANSHFVALNEYFDGHSETVRKDDLPAITLEWLARDLAANRQPLVWVIGHKPIESMPDMDNGRIRHARESVSTNAVTLATFVELLQKHQVRAYICGHTHFTSVTRVEGIWQVDSGHARGAGDTNAASTFIKIRTAGTQAWADVFRADASGRDYRLRKTVELD